MPKLVWAFTFYKGGDLVTAKALPTDLTEVQKMLESIFDQHNRRYFNSIEKILLKFSNAIGVYTKTRRHTKSNFGQGEKTLSDVFGWWLTICSFFRFDAAKLLWKKFPGVCPYCLVEKNCHCEEELRKISGKSLPSLRRSGTPPKSLLGWQNMFRRIYGKANEKASFEWAVFRLFEEIEEVNSCIFPEVKDPDALEMELADLGARIFGIANKEGIDLQNRFLFYYRGVCPRCQNEKCTCDSGW